MALRDALGDRMKEFYENRSKTKLTRKMPVIIRLDGKAFHTFTRGFMKPFDEIMIKTMQQTMQYLCENIQGCILGYTQSDEITLVLQDYYKLETDAWFDYDIQKIVSISAAMATLAFNKYYAENIAVMTEGGDEYKKYAAKLYKALFDSRAFNLPKEEVANCLIWRQLDAERNSINSLAQSLFSHKSLQGLNLKDTKAKIEAEAGIIWGNLPTTQKRGSCCIRRCAGLRDFCDQKTLEEFHSGKILCPQIPKEIWYIDNDIPRFIDEGRDYIEKLVFVGE